MGRDARDAGKLKRNRMATAAVTIAALLAIALVATDELGGSGRDAASQRDLVVALSDGDGGEPAGQPEAAAGSAEPDVAPDRTLDAGRDRPALGPGPPHEIVSVRLHREVALRESPDGAVVAVLKDRTEFGSIRKHWVVHRKRDWLGVPAAEIPDGRLGWIKDDPYKLEYEATPYRLEADLSERAVSVFRRGRVVERFPVTVGAPGSPTPPGRYAVTDGLIAKGADYYGCCVLALTGHQPNLPPGWIGGDRIAIHGTPGAIGGAESGGCLRASDEDMRELFRRVPLGTPVRIRL